MATGKRFYWIKLWEDFLESPEVDYLMSSSKYGGNYCMFYFMLAMLCKDSGGKCLSTVGSKIVPFDLNKIMRECKWFDMKFIKSALKILKEIGLIFEDEDGIITIDNFDKMVGSISDYAPQKSNQRKGNRANSKPNKDEFGVDNVHTDVHENVHTDVRGQRSEVRSQRINTVSDVVVVVNNNTESESKTVDHDHYNNVTTNDVIGCANQYFNGITDNQKNQLIAMCKALEPGMVLYGLDKAADNGALTFQYFKRTIDDYRRKGLQSVGDIKLWDAIRGEQKRRSPNMVPELLERIIAAEMKQRGRLK